MGASASPIVNASRASGATAAQLAASSVTALDRPLAVDAALVVGVPSDESEVAGAFDHGRAGLRRGSGGAPVLVGPGSVWLQLALARTDALADADAPRLLNRYVRPLLAALAEVGAPAHYFGRDWVSASKRPVAFAGFAHDATTGRALFEAVVAVTTPFAAGDRASFRGARPATLAEIARDARPSRVVDAIVEAYTSARGVEARDEPWIPPADAPSSPATPWLTTAEEAIGTVGVTRDASGRLRVGGELMASRDAIAALEARLAALADAGRLDDADEIAAAIDETLTAPGVVVFGVRALETIRTLVLGARQEP